MHRGLGRPDQRAPAAAMRFDSISFLQGSMVAIRSRNA
jgi:hypothetical protein